MNKGIAFLAALMLFWQQSAAAFEAHGRSGARQAAMGGASVTLSDIWALSNNPAGIAALQGLSAGMAFQNRFFMKELSQRSGVVAMPTRLGSFGLGFTQFGYHLYNENFVRLAYARTLHPNFRAGLGFNYIYVQAGDEYPAQQAVAFELGVQQRINSQLSMGAYLFNPSRAGFSQTTDDRLPMVIRFGLGFHFTDQLYGIAEVEKQSDRKPDIRTGLEYQYQQFFLRTGVAVNPSIFTFGMGMHLGGFTIDLSAGLHEQLGTTLQAGLQFKMQKDN
ncbi:MAG TPA: hypothetical protein PKE03_04380 [Bacteroidales bacterium]|nr:hypothetical protein [Bacteroidales bacterium]